MEEKRPQPGERYRHFKNKLYQVITIATHSETKEELVIYQALYGDFAIYARPLAMFMSEVDHEKYPDIQQKYRFEKVERNSNLEKELNQNNLNLNLSKNSKTENPAMETEIEIEISNEQDSISVETKEEILPDKTKILLEFLDCESYEEKLEYLRNTRKYIDDKMLNNISFALDIVIEEGELEDRIRSLENCLKTLRKFECNRLR